MTKKILILLISFFFISCSKKEVAYEPTSRIDPYKVYNEAFVAFEKVIIFMLKRNFLRQS